MKGRGMGGLSAAHEPIGEFLCSIRTTRGEKQVTVGKRVNENFAWVSRIETARAKITPDNINDVIRAYRLTKKEIVQLKKLATLKRVKSISEEDWLFDAINQLSPSVRRRLLMRLNNLL